MLIAEKNETKNIDLEKINTCDIVCFGIDGNSLIDKAIMFLTNSDVCHSALCVADSSAQPGVITLEESTGGKGPDGKLLGLITDNYVKNENGRVAHIRRITGNNLDLQPVLDVAKGYLEEGETYPMAELILLASILIYKKVSTPSISQKIVIKILKVATAAIKTWMEKHLYDGKHPMVCSEFVYTCFLDASKVNPKLGLKLKDPVLDDKLTLGEKITLLDHLIHHFNSGENLVLGAQNLEVVEETAEELAGQLIQSESEEHELYAPNLELGQATLEFLHAHHILKNSGGNSIIQDIKALLENEKKQQAFFVTPEDLVNNVVNESIVGELGLDKQ